MAGFLLPILTIMATRSIFGRRARQKALVISSLSDVTVTLCKFSMIGSVEMYIYTK